MKVELAHLNAQGIDFAVFAADAKSGRSEDRSELLDRLTEAARSSGLKVDKAALAYRHDEETRFFGAPDLVRYLSSSGLPSWTHEIEVD